MADVEPAEPAAIGVAEPRKAKSGVNRLARSLPAEELAPFFEQACREFAAAGASELAMWAFTQARKVEKNHPGLVDMDRLHQVFLEFTPMGVVAPTALRDHVGLMAERLEPKQAYDRYREILDAAFAKGVVPYARIYPDTRKLGRPAKVRKSVAEDDLTLRLLRSGALRYASYAVWQAAGPSLSRLVTGDDDAVRLLIAAEPDEDAEDDPELAEEIWRMWVEVLVEVGAGALLSEEWFVQNSGRCALKTLVPLVRQAGERLVPQERAASCLVTDVYSRFDVATEGQLNQETLRWLSANVPTVTEQARQDPNRFAQQLDHFITNLGRAVNIDYVAALRGLWEGVPEFRDELRRQVEQWKAGVASASLPLLSHGLRRLRKLAEHGYADLAPGFADGLRITDPVDALHAALRGGIPEELTFPYEWRTSPGGLVSEEVKLAQHGDRLTAAYRSGHVQVWTPVREKLRAWLKTHDQGLVFWDDGEQLLASLSLGGSMLTFRAVEGDDGEIGLILDPATRTRLPDGPAEAEVTFPHAAGPSRVEYRGGVITVTAPDGTQTARLPYWPLQKTDGRGPVVPPGWWCHLAVTDVRGSKALRDLHREQAARLVELALVGAGAVREEWSRILPDVVERPLRGGVSEYARTAAECVLDAVRLRERLGLPQPALPPSLRTRPELPAGGGVVMLPGMRWVEDAVREALEIPAPPEPRQVRVVTLPDWRRGLRVDFEDTGSAALHTVWPWRTAHHRRFLLENLNAWANTARGDGSGRWRLLRFTAAGRDSKATRGAIWRTPRGVLLVERHIVYEKRLIVWEYVPDGEFGPVELPGWRAYARFASRGWGGPERVLALRRLLDERGPVRPDPAWAHELADRTGMPPADAANIVFGLLEYALPFAYGDIPLSDLPKEIAALFPERGRVKVSWPLQDATREYLMPDDPAELWENGPLIARAAERYLELRDAL